MSKKPATPDFGDILDGVQAPAANDPKPDKWKSKAVAGKGAAQSRAGKVLIGGHFREEFAVQLGLLAAEERTTKQALLTEALNDLFLKKNKKQLSV